MVLNELLELVKLQRDQDNVAGAENVAEEDLMAWCQAEAGLPPMVSGGGNDCTRVVFSDAHEEEEVEEMGERSVFEVVQQL